MRLFDIFHRKNSEELEDELTKKIIEEDENNIRELQNREIPAAVIEYVPSDDKNGTAVIHTHCENFLAGILPEPGSIIWCRNNDMLIPYKCVRYDFICDKNEYDSMKTYIVVVPAKASDITTTILYD